MKITFNPRTAAEKLFAFDEAQQFVKLASKTKLEVISGERCPSDLKQVDLLFSLEGGTFKKNQQQLSVIISDGLGVDIAAVDSESEGDDKNIVEL